MIVSFSSQKGGSGKTSTLMLTATYLNYYFDKKICVVDLDIQKSFFNKRKDEIKYLELLASQNDGELHPALKEAKILKKLQQENKELYKIFTFSFDDEDLLNHIIELEKEYDIVFLDFPGTLDIRIISNLLLIIDYIFIPFYGEEKNFKSGFDFEKVVSMIKRLHIENPQKARLKDYFAYFFQYSENENKEEWEFLESSFEKRGIKKLKTPIFDSKRIEQDVSTINLITRIPSSKSPLLFVEELMTILFPTNK